MNCLIRNFERKQIKANFYVFMHLRLPIFRNKNDNDIVFINVHENDKLVKSTTLNLQASILINYKTLARLVKH